MRTLNLKWMLAAVILLAAPLFARERTGILLTDPNLKATKAQKAIKKEQDDEIAALKKGNQHHVAHRTSRRRESKIMVVSCADSHVPPEKVFNMEPGELYTNRAWGNMIDKVLLGSLEYGAEQLNCRVLVVMGHTDCTALRDAVAEYQHPKVNWDSLNKKALYEELKPGVAEMVEAQVKTQAQVGSQLEGKDLIDAVVKNNVLNTMHAIRQRSAILYNKEYKDELRIVGCIYHKDSGVVEWLK